MDFCVKAKIDTISDDVRNAESHIQAGKLIDLTPLQRKIKDLCQAISDKKNQPLVTDPSTLTRHLAALMVGLECLENRVTAKKEGLVLPKSSLEIS